MCAALTWTLVVVVGVGVCSAVNPDLDDLRLLPLDKLIAIRRALQPTGPDGDQVPGNSSELLTEGALPLRGDPGLTRHPNRRGGGWGGLSEPPVWVEEVEIPSWKGGGGKSKGLDALFQGTVTVLAFLAFGGYLICLLVHTLKEKKAALTMTMVTDSGVATGGRRRRRSVPPPPSPPAEDLYRALRHLAEGYTRYSQTCV